MPYQKPSDAIVWLSFGAMTLVLLIGAAAFSKLLRSDRNWTFADAMSGADGKPSASRLMAFLGFIVMVSIVLGVGYSALWIFLQTGQLPSLAGASTFLAASATLFAPYLANQVGLAVSGSQTPAQLAPVVMQTANQTLPTATLGLPTAMFGAPTPPPTS